MVKSPAFITETDIQGLSGERSFQRGTTYYHRKALFELMRQGNELRAYCEGSGYEAYRVSVTLNERGIEGTDCTCPYDWGGICKHLVALLLTWVHEPESFHTIPPLDEMLANRSKEALVLLIKEMLRRQPDLMRVLELPVQPDRRTPLDLDAFRRQINYALRRYNDYDYPDSRAIATELTTILETADRYREANDWANAGALYHLLLAEVVPQYSELYDEEGDVNIVLQGCAAGLDTCLTEGEPDTETRRGWLEALLEADIQDAEIGGVDLAYPAREAVIKQATDDEWSWIEARIRQVIAGKTGSYSGWARESLVGFLARRLEVQGQESEAGELISELGSPEQRAFLLLRQARFEEAVEVAQANFSDLPGLVTRFADALVEAGAGLTAEAYMASLLDTRSRSTYLSWLARYAEQVGNLSVALDWWRESIQETPSLKTYQKLREIAKTLGQWEQVRQDMLNVLMVAQSWQTLIEIALDEKDVGRALELLPSLQGWYVGDYELRVARAAEADYPQAALDIYRRRVEKLIQARGRGNYQTAANLLVRVRNVHREQHQQAAWTKYITRIRQEYKRLPALQDELNKAGV